MTEGHGIKYTPGTLSHRGRLTGEEEGSVTAGPNTANYDWLRKLDSCTASNICELLDVSLVSQEALTVIG